VERVVKEEKVEREEREDTTAASMVAITVTCVLVLMMTVSMVMMIVISDLGLLSMVITVEVVITVDTVERVEKEEREERVDTSVDTKYVKSSVKLCTTIKLSSHEKEKRRSVGRSSVTYLPFVWNEYCVYTSISLSLCVNERELFFFHRSSTRTDGYERVRFFLYLYEPCFFHFFFFYRYLDFYQYI